MQFHHLRSYRYEYVDASEDNLNLELDYENKKLSFQKILGDSANFYDAENEFFKPWLSQLSPISVILYYSESSLLDQFKFRSISLQEGFVETLGITNTIGDLDKTLRIEPTCVPKFSSNTLGYIID